MLAHVQVVNKLRVASDIPLKKVITEKFSEGNGKFFYSIEVTPKEELHIDLNDFKILPLFINITWIKDENLKQPLKKAPAFELARKIKSTHVVNSITCYNMICDHVEEIIRDMELIGNFTVLRGGEKKIKINNF